MTDVYEHNAGDHEDPIPAATWLIGFIGVVLLTVIFLGLVSLFHGAEELEQAQSVLALDPLDLEQLEQRQLEQLQGDPRWVVTRVDGEETDRQLIIPIEEAMRRVAEEMGRETPGE